MDFVPKKRPARYLWLKNISEHVVAEAAKIGAPAADATAMKAAADDLIAKMEAIRIEFVKGGVDALAIYCRLRGTAAWRKIGMDTFPPYFDTAPLAQPGVPEVREYMARGMINDAEIGLDSDIVSIAYGG